MKKNVEKDIVLTPYSETNMEGYPIGTPTVKELITILSQLPENYKVTCCGTDSYLYLFDEKDKYITIDCEYYLS